MTFKFTPADILPLDVYEGKRPQKRLELLTIKENRRVNVGPYGVFLFENADTIWWQIHEMLRIEKGGQEQIEDELQAYNPMLPQGNDLVATVMIEIPDADERRKVLAQLGHLEDTLFMEIAEKRIPGVQVNPEERTDETGKTSSVHFIRFTFDEETKGLFLEKTHPVTLGFAHPNYAYSTILTPQVHQALCEDFNV